MREPSDQELERLFKLDDAVGPARPIDGARASSIIDAALRGAGFPPAGPSGSGGGGGGHSLAGAGARRMTAGKMAAIAGGSLAAVAAVAWLAVHTMSAPDAPIVAAAPTSAPETARPPSAPVVAPPPSTPVVAAPTSAPETAPPTSAPEMPAPVQEALPLVDKPIRRRHHTRTHARSATAEPAADPPPAADLLAAANAARAQHQWRSADTLYTRVVTAGHDALASQTALVASGSLHLEHLGDPRGATRLFRSALALNGAGALAEDARWGLAETARALDDTAGELRALDDFLAHHPSSALAPRARARRDELRGTP